MKQSAHTRMKRSQKTNCEPADTGLATSWHHFTWPPPQRHATQTSQRRVFLRSSTGPSRIIFSVFDLRRGSWGSLRQTYPLIIASSCHTHGCTDLGWRVEQRWPYYFLCRRAAETRDIGLRPACRAEVALLFLVQEAATHTGPLTSAGA